MSNCLNTEWQGCYDSNWGSGDNATIVPEAYSHPAKFSRGLIERIVDHGLKRGYWKRGDTLADPFGGVALGGIICGGRGLNWVGVELEPRFVELGYRNLALHKHLFEHEGVSVKLIQGDSREFARIVGEAGGCVTSPPYAEIRQDGAGEKHDRNLDAMREGYGESKGQLSSLPVGNVEGVITSPPYAEAVKGDHGERETREEARLKQTDPSAGGGLGQSQRHGGYGVSKGQIGALKEGSVDGVVTSPPYATGDIAGPESLGRRTDDAAKRMNVVQGWGAGGQISEGNIGSLKSGAIDGVVTSPPWEDQEP